MFFSTHERLNCNWFVLFGTQVLPKGARDSSTVLATLASACSILSGQPTPPFSSSCIICSLLLEPHSSQNFVRGGGIHSARFRHGVFFLIFSAFSHWFRVYPFIERHPSFRTNAPSCSVLQAVVLFATVAMTFTVFQRMALCSRNLEICRALIVLECVCDGELAQTDLFPLPQRNFGVSDKTTRGASKNF